MIAWRLAAAAALGLAAACGRPAPRSYTVEIRGFAYLPATLEVTAGDPMMLDWNDYQRQVPATVMSASTAIKIVRVPAPRARRARQQSFAA